MIPAPLRIAPQVAAALAGRSAVVALESTVIAHGLPHPDNLHCACAMERAVADAGATAATIALMDGQVHVGLQADALEALACGEDVAKVSTRDLGPALAGRGMGATTVAATLACARAAGIEVFATGGIGGVHRDAVSTGDVSADLHALSRSPVLVVCAGAKSILDLPRTRELLETLEVPVLGFGCDHMPAFYLRDSGLTVDARVDTPQAVVAAWRRHRALDLPAAMLVTVPPPAGAALEAAEFHRWLARAEDEASASGVGGKALTPFLLQRLAVLSAGRTLAANRALLVNNAAVAGRIAQALACD